MRRDCNLLSVSSSSLSLSFSSPFTSRSHPASLSSSPPSCHLSPLTLYQPSSSPVPPKFKTVRSLFYRTRSFTDRSLSLSNFRQPSSLGGIGRVSSFDFPLPQPLVQPPIKFPRPSFLPRNSRVDESPGW